MGKLSGEGFAEGVVKWFGMIRAGGFDEAGAVSFFSGGVEGELADDEGLSVAILEGEIHLSFVVIEDAHFPDFVDEPGDVIGAIGFFDTEKDEEAVGDF